MEIKQFLHEMTSFPSRPLNNIIYVYNIFGYDWVLFYIQMLVKFTVSQQQ